MKTPHTSKQIDTRINSSLKGEVLKGLKEAVRGVNLIKTGKKKTQPLNEFLGSF